MKTLMLVGASALALSFGAAIAAEPSSTTGTMQNGAASSHQGASPTSASSEEVKQVQQKLKAEGLYKGAIDGIEGPETHEALNEFQKKNQLKVTGALDEETLSKLGIEATTGSGSSTPPSSGAPMPSPAGTNGSHK